MSGDIMPGREAVKGFAVAALLVAGAVLYRSGGLDASRWHAVLQGYAATWWAPVLLVGAMTAMYALALPGPALMLVAGALYRPPLATALVVVGGCAGGLLAYRAGRRLSAGFARRHEGRAVYRLLQNQAGFSVHCALRLVPGLPHSLLNYGAGSLRVALGPFLLGTAAGYAIKGFVYTSAVYRATHLEPDADLFSLRTLWPLLALAVLLVAGRAAGAWLGRRSARLAGPRGDRE